MAEELSVVLRRTSENSGLGFSLLGTAGLPPIIYDIVENSPAAESGEVLRKEKPSFFQLIKINLSILEYFMVY
ncbi:hypothetical protein Phum_PHUM221280 [Pediculus humanus corporis]|uniref:PDZ domain-containing protein n=1 Tax=Pediculus humanus subsp. corporis TaxID=121224 RepID=E0VI68_PEDHC|nr:uncharacterized protein Phum_PHUM221280 [Pediculus humanus corporis]EEB13074.1 hypothetical protein Phum_PHUM221280 [Pediculus humanus corporis]